jgi:hypothetical protein
MVMADFLAKTDVAEADIIAVQEPWENPYNDTTYHPLKQTHELLYPNSSETGGRARVCMYVAKRVTTWTHHVHSAFCHELRFKTTLGELRFFNIYNECGTTTTVELVQTVLEQMGTIVNPMIIIAGDFNLHHPSWGGINSRQDAGADKVIELCDIEDLDSWLEPGTITRDQGGDQTTIDLILASAMLTDRLIACEIAFECHADSDHLPIRTIIDVDTPKIIEADTTRRRLWKVMDTEKFDQFVAMNLPVYEPNLSTPKHIDTAVEHLIDIVNRGVQESTPWAKASQFANASWTKDCGEAVKESRRQFRRYLATHSEDDWEAYRLARNQKGRIIKRALRKGFRKFIEEAVEQGPKGLWKVSKWARNRGQQQSSVMPPLKTMVESCSCSVEFCPCSCLENPCSCSNESCSCSEEARSGFAESDAAKVRTLRSVFFPQPPEADLSDINTNRPHKTPFSMPSITETEIRAALKRAPPDKAPGIDTLPNKIWKVLSNQGSKSEKRFVPLITAIFDACLTVGYNPKHFQTSVTVTLRKAGKGDYRVPKAYRPVALLNTLGKLLEGVIATRIAYMVEGHKLLPNTHLGGRKGISVDHAIQLIMDRVHTAWGQGQVASMLLLDMAGAYDMVSHERLLHNMAQMGLGMLVPWVRSFLTDRSTRIKLPNGYLSEAFPTPTGIPQGSPISPILFLLFNAPLVRACTTRNVHGETRAYGWVDDVCMVAVSNSYEQNTWVLESALQRADKWARKSAAKFAPDKFELIHFKNPTVTSQTQKQHEHNSRPILEEEETQQPRKFPRIQDQRNRHLGDPR